MSLKKETRKGKKHKDNNWPRGFFSLCLGRANSQKLHNCIKFKRSYVTHFDSKLDRIMSVLKP